jgi:hypothetical protein
LHGFYLQLTYVSLFNPLTHYNTELFQNLYGQLHSHIGIDLHIVHKAMTCCFGGIHLYRQFQEHTYGNYPYSRKIALLDMKQADVTGDGIIEHYLFKAMEV